MKYIYINKAKEQFAAAGSLPLVHLGLPGDTFVVVGDRAI